MISKNDFIELEFTASIKETGEVFDTTEKDVAKKHHLLNESNETSFKSLKISVGNGMVVKGLDKALEGKEVGRNYEITISPKEAFGERNPNLTKVMSLNSFRQKGVDPQAGMVLSLDNILVRISAVSGGRVIVDFNNPLSGKEVLYKFKILKKITDNSEKVSALVYFFLQHEVKMEMQENKAEIFISHEIIESLKKELKKKIKELVGIESEFIEEKKKE